MLNFVLQVYCVSGLVQNLSISNDLTDLGKTSTWCAVFKNKTAGVENVIKNSKNKNKKIITNGGDKSNIYKTYADVVRSDIKSKQLVKQ